MIYLERLAAATSVFVRHVLSDIAIADAGGVFEAGADASRRVNP
jgi:hypothetical protein